MDIKFKYEALLLLLAACSGSGDPASEAGAGASPARAVVINELKATGSGEWIELINGGTDEVDLGGHSLADTDKSTGQPRGSDAMKFPAGTALKGGERLVILTGKKDGAGPHRGDEECLGGVAVCWHAAFGVSAKDGEAVYLLGPGGEVLSSASFPAGAGVAGEQTACRLPDTSGELVVCSPTPGAVNAGP